MIISPVTYQGGKQSIAKEIIDYINPSNNIQFFDLCCGSGAISIELINRGFPANKITMLDKSPWGLFWKMIGNGTFDLLKFKQNCDLIPNDKSKIKSFIEDIFNQSISEEYIYWFLLLQASTFGGASVWIDELKWKKSGGLRSYWLPTKNSKRRSPVNPMMPMPETIFKRVGILCNIMKGVNGLNIDVEDFVPSEKGIIYIDPPYKNTSFYGHNFDVLNFISKSKLTCFVSEATKLSEESICLSKETKKGAMSGNSAVTRQEWISKFEPVL